MSTLITSLKKHKEILLIAFIFLFAYAPIILWMWERWFAQESYYSHGILIPIVSLSLLYFKRDELKKIPFESSVWGMRFFILGIILYWISAILHIYFSAAFSMLIVLTGIILHFWGRLTFRHLLFPLSFLIFMIPLPLIVVATISFKLKILAANLATMMLNNIGLPALQEASLIKMHHTYVVVEDACGGLKSLISLAALGAIFAYQLKGRLLKKIALFTSAIPIAVIANAFRIVFLGAVGEIWGVQYAQGGLHSFSGYLVFALAFLLLFFIEQLLE